MSAISGICRFSQQQAVSSEISKMTEKLAHRGTDDSGTWCDSSVALGHRMLWSTPESLFEKLPLEKDDITITADARIDNREELIQEIPKALQGKESISDSELILEAYKEWGGDCVDRLLGDFSFAIWDKRRQHLFCARDHFGIKPFYYHAAESLFVFATEIKALFCIEDVPRRLNRLRMSDYLTSMFHDTAMTSYQEILRLPPAHCMVVSKEGIEISCYWRLDPSRTLPPASDEEYATQLREIFTEAVNCRLRSAYPVGTTLSGGLDSSSITCVARNLLGRQNKEALHTFSSVFDDLPDCDERNYTRHIFEQGKLRPHFVQGDSQTALENIEDMFWHQDEAFYAPNWFMSWPLYAEIQKQNVRVVLDGFDGDNAVSEGYGRLSELAESSRWLELAKQSWKLSRVSDLPFWKGLWAYLHHYKVKHIVERFWLLRGFRKVTNFLFSGRQQDESARWDVLLNAKFSQEVDLHQRYREWRKTQGHGGISERQRQYRNLVEQGTESFALEMLDKTVAAFKIEARYPFWDKRLIEFCLALPAEQKLQDGWTRIVMRRAMSGIVPAEVLWRRRKTDFSSNLTRSFTGNPQALAEAMTSLDFAEEFIDTDAVYSIYQRLLKMPANQDARQLWLGLSLSLWIRYAFDKENPPSDLVSSSAPDRKKVNRLEERLLSRLTSCKRTG